MIIGTGPVEKFAVNLDCQLEQLSQQFLFGVQILICLLFVNHLDQAFKQTNLFGEILVVTRLIQKWEHSTRDTLFNGKRLEDLRLKDRFAVFELVLVVLAVVHFGEAFQSLLIGCYILQILSPFTIVTKHNFSNIYKIIVANLHEKRGWRHLNFLKDADMLIVKVFGQLYYCIFVVACLSHGLLVSDSLLYVQLLQLFIQLFLFGQKLCLQCLLHVVHHRILLLN